MFMPLAHRIELTQIFMPITPPAIPYMAEPGREWALSASARESHAANGPHPAFSSLSPAWLDIRSRKTPGGGVLMRWLHDSHAILCPDALRGAVICFWAISTASIAAITGRGGGLGDPLGARRRPARRSSPPSIRIRCASFRPDVPAFRLTTLEQRQGIVIWQQARPAMLVFHFECRLGRDERGGFHSRKIADRPPSARMGW